MLFFLRIHNLLGCARVNVVSVFTSAVVNLFGAEFPHHLNFIAAACRDGIGDGDHSAQMGLSDLRNVVLNHQRIADGLYVG
jgi:hypothetical protein